MRLPQERRSSLLRGSGRPPLVPHLSAATATRSRRSSSVPESRRSHPALVKRPARSPGGTPGRKPERICTGPFRRRAGLVRPCSADPDPQARSRAGSGGEGRRLLTGRQERRDVFRRRRRRVAGPLVRRGGDRGDGGRFLRPHEQHGARRVVHHEACGRAEAVRPKPRAVAVPRSDEKVGPLGGTNHLPLHAPSADDPVDVCPVKRPGDRLEQGLAGRPCLGGHLLRRPRPGPPPAQKTADGGARRLRHVLGDDIEE